jgi:hypothetical protein
MASSPTRAWAYQAPDYKARRWILLLMADRVDVIEHNPVRMTIFVGALAALGLFGIRALARR